jgi:pyridoxal phosphate enzyme (YggS family)
VEGPTISTPELARAVEQVRRSIARACERSDRRPGEVTLIAVTKTHPVELVRAAAALGLEDFGENHASDLARKAEAVPGRWHFIGKLQAGTAPKVADHAAVIHSGEPGRALERVAHRVAQAGRGIRCLLQVDFTGQRQGVLPDDLDEAVVRASRLDGLVLAGLMTLPPWTGDPEATREFFRRLRQMRDRLRATWPGLDELSMGMSEDYAVAVEEGATMVRVGTALFGPRSPGRSLPTDRG